MKATDRAKLKGVMGLLDQALAPLTNAFNIIKDLVDQEEIEVDELEDAETDKNLERRDKLEVMLEVVEKLGDMIEELNKAKDEIEAY
jgi:hypothetical protein